MTIQALNWDYVKTPAPAQSSPNSFHAGQSYQIKKETTLKNGPDPMTEITLHFFTSAQLSTPNEIVILTTNFSSMICVNSINSLASELDYYSSSVAGTLFNNLQNKHNKQ